MKKLFLILAVSLAFSSCKKDNPEPNYSSSGNSSTEIDNSIKDCEKYNFSTLRVINITYNDFYVYINNVYVGKSTMQNVFEFNSVPAGLTHKIQVISIQDNSDYREASLYFTQCSKSQLTLQ